MRLNRASRPVGPGSIPASTRASLAFQFVHLPVIMADGDGNPRLSLRNGEVVQRRMPSIQVTYGLARRKGRVAPLLADHVLLLLFLSPCTCDATNNDDITR